MAKRDKKKKFQLFLHEDIEVKKQLLQAARSLQAGQGIGDALASALIYASLTEYLGENLLENLRELMYQITYRQYAGIVFIDERHDERKRTLGQTLAELKKYDFPDKAEILDLLEAISSSRNNVFHNLAKTKAENASALDIDIKTIMDATEILIDKIDIIYAGLSKIILPTPDEPPVEQAKQEDTHKDVTGPSTAEQR